MRPSVTEQLYGASRLLARRVAPALTDPQAANVLSTVIADLRILANGCNAVLPFLYWDNDATRALLCEARDTVEEPLRSSITAALEASTTEPSLDFDEASEYNNRLRRALVDVVTEQDMDAQMRARITDHFVKRAARYPMRMSLSLPSAQESDDVDPA